MVTVDAAKVAGLTERLGAIRHGNAADLLLAVRKDADPYESLLKTGPSDISLVFIGGVPCYGSEKLLSRWIPADELDRLEILGIDGPKAIHLVGDPPAHVVGGNTMDSWLRSCEKHFPSWPP